MKIKLSRRAAALTGVALAVSSLPMLTLSTSANAEETPAPPAATTTYKKSLTYRCDISTIAGALGPIEIPNDDVKADITFSLPKFSKRLTTLDPVDISVKLTLSEFLRSQSIETIGAVAADGESTNTVLSLTTDAKGNRKYYRIPKLSAEKSDIPTTAGAPWTIEASGKSPAVQIPYASSTTISAPEQFDITSTLYKPDGTSQPADLSCDTATSRSLATIKIGEPAIVSAKLSPSTLKAKKTEATVSVKVRTTSGQVPTGSIFVYDEEGPGYAGNEKTLGETGFLENGTTTVKLRAIRDTGKRYLRVYYDGDDRVDPLLIKVPYVVKK